MSIEISHSPVVSGICGVCVCVCVSVCIHSEGGDERQWGEKMWGALHTTSVVVFIRTIWTV